MKVKVGRRTCLCSFSLDSVECIENIFCIVDEIFYVFYACTYYNLSANRQFVCEVDCHRIILSEYNADKIKNIMDAKK